MEAYLIGGVRTAIGAYNGSLASLNAIDLGEVVIRDLIKRASVDGEEVQEVIMGNVIGSGLGPNPARIAAIKAGLPEEVPAYTVNKLCGSGLKTAALASQAIASGESDLIVAGGMEHMTNAPYVTQTHRWGQRMGDGKILDTLTTDALWDKFYDCHMGTTAENIAVKYEVSREDQDAFAAYSQQKAEKAITEGSFKEEIVPIQIKQRRKEDKIFDTDEYPRFGATAEALAKLRPAFSRDGSVTAGNASGINDGGAAVLVASKEKMEALNPPSAFKIVGSQSAGLSPAYMGLGPINACKLLLPRINCSIDDLDLIEVNEAFASQSIQVHREMGWDIDKVNVLGGAIALGHPLGASGTRVLVTLMYQMIKREVNLGLASLCIGGGQGIAMVIERVR